MRVAHDWYALVWVLFRFHSIVPPANANAERRGALFDFTTKEPPHVVQNARKRSRKEFLSESAKESGWLIVPIE
jgi:hypothetical protein